MSPDGDETTPSLAAQFAEAFASEGDTSADAKAASSAKAGDDKAADTSKQGETSGGDGDTKEADRFAGVTLDDLLKHAELGKVLNSWNDKTTNSRLASERQAAESTGVERGKAQAASATRASYFQGLNDEELAEELKSPKVRAEYDQWVRERPQPRGDGEMDSETAARTAQVLAMATTVAANNTLLAESGLSDADKAKLHPDNYVQQGPAGLVAWTKDLNKAIATHEAAKLADSKFADMTEAERQQRQANEDENRPGAFRAPARRTAASPDFMKMPTSKGFEHAFGG